MGWVEDKIIDPVVDVITDIVDLVVDVVEDVVGGIGDVLGFDSDTQVIQQFEVYNQPLFNEPDKNTTQNVILKSVTKNEDLVANLLFADVFQNGKKNITNFVGSIDNAEYFEDFPVIQASIHYVDLVEVKSVLDSKESTSCTIEKAKLSSLFVDTWVYYWLQENKGYDLVSNTITYNSTVYNLDAFRTVYNITTDDYTLTFSDTNGSITPSYNVPPKASGLHYVIEYHTDASPLVRKLFTYEVGLGTYTVLDDPTLHFTDTGTTALDILPAVPLRINNTNFNETVTTKSDQINNLIGKLGFDGDQLIESIMNDVAASGIENYETKVDHVFLNFGVRVWDTSQIGMNYLFRMSSILESAQGVTKAIYDATPSTEDKPYNSIIVRASDYEFVFRYAYITYQHYDLSEVIADSTLNAIYYSDLKRFDDNNNLVSTYYSSSGITSYNVGYKAETLLEVQSFLNNTLTQESSYTAEAANWLQVSERFDYPAVVVNSDGSRNYSGVLRPDNVYEIDPEYITEEFLVESWNSTYTESFAPSDGFLSISIKTEHSSGACSLGSTYGILSNPSGNTGIWVDGNCRATFEVAYGANSNFTASDSSYSGVTTTGTPFSYLHDGDANTTWTCQPSEGDTYITVDLGDLGPQFFHEFHVQGEGYHTTQLYNLYYEIEIQYSDDGSAWTTTDTATGTTAVCDSTMGTCTGTNDFIEIYNTHNSPHKYWRIVFDRLDTGDDSYPVDILDVDAYLTQTAHLKIVNRALEATTQGQEFHYYQCVANGLNVYTMKAPIGLLKVVDAQTGVFKMVKFNIANKNDLMLPFSFDIVKDLPNSHVTSLFMASSHISIYVADYQVIKLPWWVTLLQIVQIVLIIIAIVTFNPAALEGAAYMQYLGEQAVKVLVNLLIKEVVVYIAEEISPELALIVGIALSYEYGGGKELDYSAFGDLALLFGNTADIIGSVVSTVNESNLEAIQEESQRLLEEYTDTMDSLQEIKEDLFYRPDNSVISVLDMDVRGSINPMLPNVYYDYYSNFNTLGLLDYDIDNKINSTFNTDLMST